MEKIKVIQVIESTSGEMPLLYRMDDGSTPKRFFNNIVNNVELNEPMTVTLMELTQEEWAEAERLGEEMA